VRVTFLSPAALDVADAMEYYQRRTAGLAGELDRDLTRTLEIIRSHPRLGSPFERGTRRMLLARFPFAVVYREMEDRIVVVAFSHVRRAPEHWRGRVE